MLIKGTKEAVRCLDCDKPVKRCVCPPCEHGSPRGQGCLLCWSKVISGVPLR